MSNQLFVKATRRKYRFKVSRGNVSVEDLWDLDLDDLDKIAIQTNEEIQKQGKQSFVKTKSVANTDLTNKLDILKFIIETKLTEDEARKTRAEKASQKDLLKTLLEKKKMEELENLTPEQIQAKLAELG